MYTYMYMQLLSHGSGKKNTKLVHAKLRLFLIAKLSTQVIVRYDYMYSVHLHCVIVNVHVIGIV